MDLKNKPSALSANDSTQSAEHPECLRSSIIFRSTSTELLAAIWQAGEFVTLKAGEVIDISSPAILFLNYVLSGELEVGFISPNQQPRTRRLIKDHFFGSISLFLGIGRFIKGKVISETRLFTLSSNKLQLLLNRFPEFEQNLAQLRLAIALRNAQSFDKDHSGDGPQSIRIAPRFSTAGMQLRVRLNDSAIYAINNISETGLFLEGEIAVTVGDEIQFELCSQDHRTGGNNFVGTIVQKTPAGVGIHLHGFSDHTREFWLELLVIAEHLRVQQFLQPHLSQLKNTLPKPAKLELVGKDSTEDHITLQREINSPSNLCKFYFQELIEQIIYLRSALPIKPDQRVAIKIKLDPHALPITRSLATTTLFGKALRQEGYDVVIRLDSDSLDYAKRIQSVVNSITHRQSRTSIRKGVHAEHNLKHRRFQQLWLILLLIVAVAIWLTVSR